MVPKSLLTSAKAFLCWEAMENLSIQLVPMQEAVAYFYPPQATHSSIVLFYEAQADEYAESLFLLFHEAGHAQQWRSYIAQGQAERFRQMLDLDKGPEKLAFEKEAWGLGKRLLLAFSVKHELAAEELGKSFQQYAERCLQSYAE